MRNLLEKTKALNYIASLLFIVMTVVFIRMLGVFVWNLDIFDTERMLKFCKFIASGKILKSPKYISFVVTFVGSVIMMVSGVNIAMHIEYPTENTEEDKKETNNNSVEEKVTEPAEVKVIEIPAAEKRFEMYNKPTIEEENANHNVEEEIKEEPATGFRESKIQKENIEPIQERETLHLNENPEEIEESVSDDEERAKLQSKIREVMERMREKQNEENNKEDVDAKVNVNPVIEPEVATEEPNTEMGTQKILEPMQFEGKGKNPLLQNMNFSKISPEENNAMERTLIGAGFKLLSEIRIGSTGIDYLAVGKDKLVVVQLDTTDGNWSASEEVVEGSAAPVWFSENGSKISPVARAIEARNDILKLIEGQIQTPIETIACLTNSYIVNETDMRGEWNKLGVRMARLNEVEGLYDNIEILNSIFPEKSQTPPSEADMTKLISILEKAEIPE